MDHKTFPRPNKTAEQEVQRLISAGFNPRALIAALSEKEPSRLPNSGPSTPMAKVRRKKSAALVQKERHAAATQAVCKAAVVRKLGGTAEVLIWPNSSADPLQNSWLWNCNILSAPRLARPRKGSGETVTGFLPNWRALVGMASVVGELLIVDEVDPARIKDLFEGIYMSEDGMSASDLELMGDEWSYADIDQIIAILKEEEVEIMLDMAILELTNDF